MKRFKKIIIMAIVCVFAFSLLGLTACTPKTKPSDEEITVTLDKQTATVVAEETFVLTATVTNSSEVPTFKSSAVSIATVSGNGKIATVNGVAAGSATVTASVGEKSASCIVTVTAPIVEEKLSLDKEYIVMEDGGEALTSATLTAEYNIKGTLAFASLNEDIVTVTSDEKVATLTAHKIGKATVTATVGEKTVSCKVEVATYGLDYQLVELDVDEESTITVLSVLDVAKDLTGEVRIPAQYWSDEEEDFFPVAVVAKDGFKGNKGITSVDLGEGVISIGASAFADCSALTAFNWDESCKVQVIGANAFSSSGLIDFVVPVTAKGFNYGMFQLALNLESVKIYAPIVQIFDSTFLKSDSLTEIWLPATLTKISAGAFGGYAGFPTDGPGSKGSFTVHFAGTEEQWDAIEIADSNNSVIIKGKNSKLIINYNVVY